MSYCTQCAAEVDRLMDVIAQLQEIVNSDTAEEERIRAENERLRAALKPFACKCAVEAGPECLFRNNGRCCNYAARAALEELPHD